MEFGQRNNVRKNFENTEFVGNKKMTANLGKHILDTIENPRNPSTKDTSSKR